MPDRPQTSNPALRDGVIVNVVRPVDGGQLLYMRRVLGRYQDQWWPVAGKADLGETPLQAALRELQEETALIPRQVFRLDRVIPNSDPRYRLHGFVALVAPEAQVRLNEEHDAFRWLSIDETLSMLGPGIHDFIHALAQGYVWREPDAALRCWPTGPA